MKNQGQSSSKGRTRRRRSISIVASETTLKVILVKDVPICWGQNRSSMWRLIVYSRSNSSLGWLPRRILRSMVFLQNMIRVLFRKLNPFLQIDSCNPQAERVASLWMSFLRLNLDPRVTRLTIKASSRIGLPDLTERNPLILLRVVNFIHSIPSDSSFYRLAGRYWRGNLIEVGDNRHGKMSQR